ncbi:MAG: ABC transporter permease [Blastocatellia bacterium]
MEALLKDFRYGTRMLMKNRGFTAVAVLSLALGIGANSTIFGWVRGVLFRPFPGVSESDRMVVFAGTSPAGSYTSTSYPDYVDLAGNNKVLDGFIVFDMTPMSLNIGGEAQRVYGAVVSGNYFGVLGVNAAIGRTFLPEEDKTPNTHPVAVISHGLWRRVFGSDPDVAGKTVTLNGHPFTVVGVAPESFTGTFVGLSIDLWVPMMAHEQVVPGGNHTASRGDHWLQAMGRLKPGVSIEQAQTELDTIARQLAQEYPRTNEGRGAALFPLWKSPWGATVVLRPVLFVLMAVVGLVLLIACANVANLLLARAVGRRREIAIRLSMGASRGRLIRQLLTESLLLALAGGAGGLLIAYWGSGLLMAIVPPMNIPVKLFLGVDGGVLWFTFAISVLTGVIFGLAPALQASNPNLVAALKDETAKSSGGRGKARLRDALVIAQVALSLVLLIGAGLFIQSLQRGQTISPGFNTQNVLVAGLDLFSTGYGKEKGESLQQQLLQRVEALPGVQSAAIARRVPLALAGSSSTRLTVDGYEPRPEEEPFVEFNTVSPGYFRTMSIPIVQGREFDAQDNVQSRKVAIINETMARRYWPGRDPVGQKFRTYDYFEVIGVAKNIKYRNLGEDPRPYFYYSLLQNYQPEVALHVRADGDPTSLLPAVREVAQSLSPDLALYDAQPLYEQLTLSMIPQRIAAILLGVFGLLALALAAVGLYGVMAHSVSQRTREIGIRMALGASPRDVLGLVVGQGMLLAAVGVAIGLAGALGLTRFLASLLYGVSATDPMTFAATPLLLAAVALVASFIPARRATKVDPMIALRHE